MGERKLSGSVNTVHSCRQWCHLLFRGHRYIEYGDLGSCGRMFVLGFLVTLEGS